MRNFGEPAHEYEAARTASAFIVRTDRALLRVFGRDPVRIIQGIVSNDVASSPAHRAIYSTLLTPKGRMVADVRVLRRTDDLLLDVPAAAVPSLLELFKRTIPPLFAKFENITAAYTMFSVCGPSSHAIVKAVVGNIPALDPIDGFTTAVVDGDEVLICTTRDTGDDCYDLFAPHRLSHELSAQMLHEGATQIGESTFDVLRIEAGTPRWGAELDETTIPLEADLLQRAISTSKGCYTGQEVIIRILHRGHVNWHLRGVLLGDAPTPARGAELVNAEGRKAGRITSAAWSPRHEQTIALAYVRREIEPPATLQRESAAVEIVALPF